MFNIITGDKKWDLYKKHSTKKQWILKGESRQANPKAELHGRKNNVVCIMESPLYNPF